MKPIAAALFLILSTVVSAAEPVKPSPFPVLPVQPSDPSPKTDPNAEPVLSEDLVYIVKDDAEFVLRASPKGLVSITKAVSPQVYAKFVGGNGKYKLETFKEKNVAIVTAVPGAKGKVELIYSPSGAKDDSTDISRMLVVGNLAPQPPPVDPKVDPAPAPKPAEVKSFRVIFVRDDKKALTAAQHSVMYSAAVSDWLIKNCTKDDDSNGVRRKDWKSTAELESPAIKAIWEAVQPKLTAIPCVVIEVNGHADILDLPATPDAAIALFDSYKNPKK